MRGPTAAALTAACCLAAAAPAAAAPSGPWDGANPFQCTVQNVAFGTDFPDPDADPFCVEFDKRRQNLTELGLLDFLAQEPARVAAASNKCFYWQTDRWRGSVVQDDGRTETYGWDGSYYFDKARGAGGVHVREFRIAGQKGDPTTIPGFPADYRPYFGPGRGGFHYGGGEIEMEPRCVALAETRAVYRPPGSPPRCRVPGGRITRAIGGVRLGLRRATVRRLLGAPTRESPGSAHYCLQGGGTLSAGFERRDEGARVSVVRADNPAFRSFRGVRPGASERSVRRAMRWQRVRRRRDGTKLLVLRQPRRTLVALVRRRRVAWVAVTRPRISMRALGRELRRVR